MMVMMIIIISGASELKGRRFRIDTSGLIANYFYTHNLSNFFNIINFKKNENNEKRDTNVAIVLVMT